MKGNAGIFVIIGIIALSFLGFLYYMGFFSLYKTPSPPPALNQNGPGPAGGYKTLSEDPKYKYVKEKYNLSEEQLQILSTVDPEDND